MTNLTALALGFLLDALFGDPRWAPHPIVAIGKLIAALTRGLRRLLPKTPGGELWGGAVLAAVVPLASLGLSWGALRLCGLVSPWLRFALETFWCYQILAARCLRDEAMNVYRALKTGKLDDARAAVGRIVGRDTQSLSAEGVTKAAVETVAENTSDGVIAPMLFIALGGAPLGFFYKAINTMDSMVGYKNDEFLYFGRCAARLDDAANWIPARVSALLMILAAYVLPGMRGSDAARIWRRDRRNHKSPNSAQTESVCAGALGVQLAGDAIYFGNLVRKPTIGDPLRPVEPEDIPRSCRLLYGTAVDCLALLGAVFFLFLLF